MDRKVFISYASEDKEFTERLVNDLKRHSIVVWFAPEESQAGDFRKEIDRQLDECRFYVPVLTPHYFKKPYTRYEWDGMVHNHVHREKMIIPVILEACEENIPPALRDLENVSTQRSAYPELLAKLVSLLSDAGGPITGKDFWPPHAFVLEDRRTILKLLVAELEGFPFVVHQASTMSEARIQIEEMRRCDLIILDLHIEGEIRGWEIAELCNSRFGECQRYILSGHTSEEAKLKELPAAKAWKFIAKSARGAYDVRKRAAEWYNTIRAQREPKAAV